MKTVIILNGCPHIGKDTIADLIVKQLGANKIQFKDALYEETAKYYDYYDLELFTNIASTRELKDSLLSAFSVEFSVTPRQALIHVSEEVIKPIFGGDYFGKLSANKLKEGINIFSDSGGWWDEASPVIEAADKTIIVKLHREGFTFEGDSRNYFVDHNIPVSLVPKVSLHGLNLQDNKPQLAVDLIKKFVGVI